MRLTILRLALVAMLILAMLSDGDKKTHALLIAVLLQLGVIEAITDERRDEA